METAQKTLIGLLVLAVLVVGYFIFIDRSSKTGLNTGVNNTKTVTGPSGGKVNVDNSGTGIIENRVANVEELLKLNPGSGATTDQMRVFSAKVSNFATDTSSVDVTSCAPNPSVARVTLNKPINFVNSDSVAHKLVNGKITIDVPAKGSKKITPAFQGPGIYGYSCDTKISGIFLVVP